jgi:hypothetical protein
LRASVPCARFCAPSCVRRRSPQRSSTFGGGGGGEGEGESELHARRVRRMLDASPR